MKIRTPITVFYDGAYRPPGTVIDLPEDEAKSFIERFGDLGDAEVTNSIEDLNSVAELNKQAAIHGGHGNG